MRTVEPSIGSGRRLGRDDLCPGCLPSHTPDQVGEPSTVPRRGEKDHDGNRSAAEKAGRRSTRPVGSDRVGCGRSRFRPRGISSAVASATGGRPGTTACTTGTSTGTISTRSARAANRRPATPRVNAATAEVTGRFHRPCTDGSGDGAADRSTAAHGAPRRPARRSAGSTGRATGTGCSSAAGDAPGFAAAGANDDAAVAAGRPAAVFTLGGVVARPRPATDPAIRARGRVPTGFWRPDATVATAGQQLASSYPKGYGQQQAGERGSPRPDRNRGTPDSTAPDIAAASGPDPDSDTRTRWERSTAGADRPICERSARARARPRRGYSGDAR